ncbi:MAG: hypothetical protein ACR2P2_06430 [Nakamurella sp.]
MLLRSSDVLDDPMWIGIAGVRPHSAEPRPVGVGLEGSPVQLLAAVLLTPDIVLWTRDKRLRTAATAAAVSWA